MILEKAYAKINVGLDITGKRHDGYHDIDTIMQSILLHDEIIIEKASGISIGCSDPTIPVGESNTVFLAAKVFLEKAGLDPFVNGSRIEIIKKIPPKAGLGGGSSDAAAVIRGLNKLYCTELSTSIMEELALKVGSDVPFCIKGGTQRAKGRGEKLTEINEFEGIPVLLVMPGETVNTAYAYSLFSNAKNAVHPNMDAVASAVNIGDLAQLSSFAGNTFESLVFPEKPAIEKAKHDILDTGALVCQMTGSGAAVYGLYDTRSHAESAEKTLAETYCTYLTETTGRNQ